MELPPYYYKEFPYKKKADLITGCFITMCFIPVLWPILFVWICIHLVMREKSKPFKIIIIRDSEHVEMSWPKRWGREIIDLSFMNNVEIFPDYERGWHLLRIAMRDGSFYKLYFLGNELGKAQEVGSTIIEAWSKVILSPSEIIEWTGKLLDNIISTSVI